MEKYLNELSPKAFGTVKKILAEGKMKRRLYDMGVTPGVGIVVKKLAPMGDPMEITIRGYELTIRKSEAQTIVMEVK